MKERYKWPFYGIGLGLVTSLFSRFMMMKQAGMDISFKTLVGNPFSVWTRTLAPFVLGIVFFYIGVSRDRLIEHRKAVEKKNKELQKAMIDQSMELGAELNRTMGELNRYTEQLDKIINNIRAGVCLINRDFRIEEGFNNSFTEIFGHKEYLDNSIFNTVFAMLNDDQKKAMRDFLEQCFENVTASDSMLTDANPLEEFDYLYIEEGSVVPKTVKTRVVRLKNSSNEIEKILFLFDDITSRKELEQSIVRQEEEYNKKYGIVVSLLGNDKEVTRNFIKDLESDLKNIGDSIKDLRQNEVNSELIGKMIGMVHSVKGEAFSLDFKSLAQQAADFEKYLKEIKDKVLDLETNLEIVNYYEKINNEHRAFEKIIEDLTEFIYGENVKKKQTDTGDVKASIEENTKKFDSLNELNEDERPFSLLLKELKVVAEKTASEKGKKAELRLESEVEKIPGETYRHLKEVLIHLVRNSVDHGIESPGERVKNGKTEEGHIYIKVKKTDNGLELDYSDDGRGFDVDKIKKKAVEKGLVDSSTIDGMDSRDVIRLIFRDGFSTSSDVDMVSGMGVGMSVVRKNITDQMNGKLGIVNKGDRGVTFKISIPL